MHHLGRAMQRQRLRYRYRRSQWTLCWDVYRPVGRQAEVQEAEVEVDHRGRHRHHRRDNLQDLQKREPLAHS